MEPKELQRIRPEALLSSPLSRTEESPLPPQPDRNTKDVNRAKNSRSNEGETARICDGVANGDRGSSCTPKTVNAGPLDDLLALGIGHVRANLPHFG